MKAYFIAILTLFTCIATVARAKEKADEYMKDKK